MSRALKEVYMFRGASSKDTRSSSIMSPLRTLLWSWSRHNALSWLSLLLSTLFTRAVYSVFTLRSCYFSTIHWCSFLLWYQVKINGSHRHFLVCLLLSYRGSVAGRHEIAAVTGLFCLTELSFLNSTNSFMIENDTEYIWRAHKLASEFCL